MKQLTLVKNRARIGVIAALLFSMLGLATASAQSLTPAQVTQANRILADVDRLSNFTDVDFKATVTIVSEEPGEDTSVLKSTFFRRDKDGKFLVLINEPAVQKGEGYLREGDNLWFYDPNTRQFSFTSLSERFAGSSANNNDFSSSSLSEDYEVIELSEGRLGANNVNILKLKAKNDKVTYPFLKIWVTKDRNLVLMQEEYSLSNRLMRTSLYTRHTQVQGRWIPLSQVFIDNINVGQKSQLSISDVSIGRIPDSVFTKDYVERVNR